MENPAIKKIQEMQKDGAIDLASGGQATYKGVMQKEAAMLAIVIASAVATVATGYATPVTTMVTAFMAFVVGLVICFRPSMAETLTPAYAILEGMGIGAISLWMERLYPNIVVQAVMLTFSVALVAWFVFSRGFIKVNGTFIKATVVATGSVLVFSIAQIIAIVFFGANFSFLDGGPLAILIDLVIIGIATMNLFVDYHHIQESVENGLPKEYEWMCAFSLLVTLIWLYLRALELLRDSRR